MQKQAEELNGVSIEKQWREEIPSEVSFWDKWVRDRGGNWKQEFAARTNPESILQNHISKYINPSLPKVKILDVGAGPLTIVNKKYPGVELDICAIDPLAGYYNQILAKYGVNPIIRTERLSAEKISDKYEENSLDITYSRNAIDHSYNPIKAIQEMVKVTKSGGYIILQVGVREGTRTKWSGLHSWDFYLKDNALFLKGRSTAEYNISERIKDDVDLAELKTEKGMITIVFRRKSLSTSFNDSWGGKNSSIKYDLATTAIAHVQKKYSNMLKLEEFFECMDGYVVLKLSEDFPNYCDYSDIDILCEDVEKVQSHILRVGKKYMRSGFRIAIARQGDNAHIDFYSPGTERLNFRFDLLENLSYEKFKVKQDFTDIVLNGRRKIKCGKTDIFVPSWEYDLAIRLMEYIEYKDKRPDKIKHLNYVGRFETTAYVDVINKYTNLQLSVRKSADNISLTIGKNKLSGESSAKKCRMDYFMIWGHGLQYTSEILDIIRSVKDFRIIAIIRKQVEDMNRFVQDIYACDTVPFKHLISKTKYLLKTRPEIIFILIENNNAQEKYFGEGEFRHVQCQLVKNIKEEIRNKFNPRINGKRTENHVIHASDYESQVEHVLGVLELRPLNYYTREPNVDIDVPYHIEPFSKYDIREVDIEALKASINAMGLVPIRETPHYKYLTGDKSIYIDYQNRYFGTLLTDDHTTESYDRLIAEFNYGGRTDLGKRSLILACPVNGSEYRIQDGVHRAAILAYKGIQKVEIAVPLRDSKTNIAIGDEVEQKWKAEPKKIIAADTKSRDLGCLIFSKDRAMQLRATLDSFFLHCRDYQKADLTVLYHTSNELNHSQYQQLKKRYPDILFLKEQNFKKQVILVIKYYEYVLFLVDDNIFTRPFRISDIQSALISQKQALGFSLRLGTNTNYCYSLSSRQKLPEFEKIDVDVMKYSWPGQQCDFGYPLEVSSSVYRCADILTLVEQSQFSNPNQFESALNKAKNIYDSKSHMLTFRKSVTFCNPVNVAQDVYGNKFGTVHNYTTEQLAKDFSEGMIIDVEKYIGFTSNAAHQEVPLYFKPAGTENLTEPVKDIYEDSHNRPKFSIIMANYNNENYISQAIESVLSQTFSDWELIIIDDSSTDNSLQIIQRYLGDKRIKLIHLKANRGYVNALKTGIENIRSEIFGILDSDDCLTEDAIAVMYESHMDHPECGLIYSQFMYCDKNLTSRHVGYCTEIPDGQTNLENNVVSHFKTFKLRDYLRTSGYDEQILYAEDKDIIYKMEEVTCLKFIDKCLYLYRELPDSQGHDSVKQQIGLRSMEKAKFSALSRRAKNQAEDCMRRVSDTDSNFPNKEAVDYFLKARKEFEQNNFQRASELMGLYRTSVDYRLLSRFARSDKDKKVDVSVVIVTYNRTEDVKKCVESVVRQRTSRETYEIIVVGNGLTDEDIIKALCDQYIQCPANLYLSEGRNIGAVFARGRILAFLDDDALVDENYISSVKQAFDEYDIFGFRGKVLPKTDPDVNRGAVNYDRGDDVFCTFCDQEGNSAFLKNVYLDTDGMDPLLFGAEGSDLSYRIIKKYRCLNKIIYWPRTVIYHDNAPQEIQAQKKSRYELMHRYFQLKHGRAVFELCREVERKELPNKRSHGLGQKNVQIFPKKSVDNNGVPVALITYNRPRHTYEVLHALREHNIKNIYIFSDGPKREEDVEKISVIRKLARTIDWARPKIIEQEENVGLARNIVGAVDHVLAENDRLVVLEDDCVPQKHFFDFMNGCLDIYAGNEKIFGISGYTVQLPDEVLQRWPWDMYFYPRIGSCGWGTWKRAWRHLERDLKSACLKVQQNNIDICQGGSDVPRMIEQFLEGSLREAWTFNWVLTVYLHGGHYIYPSESHIRNIGFDGSGVHRGDGSKFESRISDSKPQKFPEEVVLNDEICKYLRSFYDVPNYPKSSVSIPSKSVYRRGSDSNSGLKIGYINTLDKVGGAAKVVWTLKEKVKQKGYSAKLFVRSNSSHDQDVHVIRDDNLDRGGDNARQGLLYYDIKSTFSLPRNPYLAECDILHFHNLHGDYFNPFGLPELTRMKPSLWTLHDMQSFTGHCAHSFDCTKWKNGCGNCPDLSISPAIPVDATARLLSDKKEIYESTDITIVVPSRWLGDKVGKSVLKDKPVELIYNGIDTDVFRQYPRNAVRQELGLPLEGLILAFTAQGGMNNPWRDGRCLVDTVNYIATKNKSVYFLNVGGGRDFNVPNTLNVPYIADERTLAKVYSAADIFLFPSLADNCPLVVLEAMACGLATIAYQTGGIPEIIENGKSGIITPYRNRAEFIKAVDRLISDSERRNALGTNARERVRQDFAVDLMVDKYVTLYQRLLSDSSARTRQTEIKTAVAIPNTVKQEQQYLVSAIVSTYNAGEFIRGCLEDLENQTIADKLEIIVVNSGSQQNEEAIVKEFQKKYDNIVYIKTEEREGLYKAWNRAVKAARGTFLTNANTDDRHRRDAFEIMSKELLASPDIALVYGDQICTDTPNGTFDSHHAVELAKRPEFSWQRLLFGCCVGSQPMWRKSLHDELGYFDETMDCASDWEFWLRTAQKYKFRRIPEFLGLYYRNEDGIEHGRKIHSLYERYIVGKKYGNPYISVIPIYTAKDNPLVSVIMPAFNASRYIAESIESVLIQSYRNFELIIVDDGSTDNTREVASRFKDDKIKYFYQPNKGVSAARNLAIAKAKGTYIMPLDSDDMITPNSIAMHLEAFGKNPEVDLVYSDVLLINSESKPIKVNKKPEYLDRRFMIRDLVRAGHPVVPFRLGIRRCVFDKIGLYDESLIIGEDYDMMRRFVKEGLRVYHLNSPMHMRRITENSLTTDTRFAKMVAAKSKCHFNVIRRYTETFTYEEIFPDIQWVLIPPATRQLHFKCLVALNFISLGQNYIKKGLPVYARTSLVRAEKELDKCLEIDPDNGQVRQLLNKCQKIGANLSEPAILST